MAILFQSIRAKGSRGSILPSGWRDRQVGETTRKIDARPVVQFVLFVIVVFIEASVVTPAQDSVRDIATFVRTDDAPVAPMVESSTQVTSTSPSTTTPAIPPATSEGNIKFYSDFVKVGKVAPQNCIAEAKFLREVLANYPHREDWTYIIVCDDVGWNRYLTHVGFASAQNATHYGETYLTPGVRTTWFRGATFLDPDNFRARGDRVIAHELAHIALNSGDEKKVEALALQWMRMVAAKKLLIQKSNNVETIVAQTVPHANSIK